MAAVSECGCGILVSVKAVTGCGGYGCNCVAFAAAAVAAVNCPSSAVSTLSLGGGRVVLVVTVSAIGDAAINAEAGVCCSGCVCDGGVCDGGVCGGWGGRGCHGGPFFRVGELLRIVFATAAVCCGNCWKSWWYWWCR